MQHPKGWSSLVVCLVSLAIAPLSHAQPCACTSLAVDTIVGTLGTLHLFGSGPRPLVVINSSTTIDSGAQFEVYGRDAGFALVTTANPGTAVEEAFLVTFGYDASGRIVKTSSISTHWVTPDPQEGYNVMRLNATYLEGGVQRDDIFLRGWGRQGAAFFKSAESPPGERVLEIEGMLHLTGGIQPDDCALSSHTGRMAMDPSGGGRIYVCDQMGQVRGWKVMMDLSD